MYTCMCVCVNLYVNICILILKWPENASQVIPPSSSFYLVSKLKGVSGIYESAVLPSGDRVSFPIEADKLTSPGLVHAVTNLRANILEKNRIGVEESGTHINSHTH